MIESNIWGGSEIKVNGSIAPYYTPLIGAGVALRLRAVQVIQYVQGNNTSSRFGFEEEKGYEHKAPETFEEVVADATPTAVIPEQKSQVKVDEPVVRPETTPPVKPADDLSDIINQWAKD